MSSDGFSPIAPAGPASVRCRECGCEHSARALLCPQCRALVHAQRLKELADEAESATQAGQYREARAKWSEALTLLPPGSKQHAAVSQRWQALSEPAAKQPELEPAGGEKGSGRWKGILAGFGSIGLLLWKFKFVAVFIASKAKFLLLGLSKGGTFVSMALSFGVYWVAWGWAFALGLVGSIYVHEMGHVAALRRLGVPATAPMFIPGLGAVIRLKAMPASPKEDARVGLAGPIWGLGAALFCYGVYWYTGAEAWGAIAKVGAWINLFNMTPVWQLDGSRAFHAFTRGQRWIALAVIVGCWFVTAEDMLALVGLVALVRIYGEGAKIADNVALGQYCVLIVALAWLAGIPVSVGAAMGN